MRYFAVAVIFLLCFSIMSIAKGYEREAFKKKEEAARRKEETARCRAFNPALYKKIQDSFYGAMREYDLQHYQYSAEIFSECLYLCEMIEESEKYGNEMQDSEKKVREAESVLQKALRWDSMRYLENETAQSKEFYAIAEELFQKGKYAYENGQMKIVNRRDRIDNISVNAKKVVDLLSWYLPKLEAFHKIDEMIRIIEDKIEAYKNSQAMVKNARKFSMLRDWFAFEKNRFEKMKCDFKNVKTEDLYEMMNRFNEFDIALTRLMEAPEYITFVEETDDSKISKLIAEGPDEMLYIVKKGDTLWRIAGKLYKDPKKWRKLYKMNTDVIENPNLIFPKEILKY